MADILNDRLIVVHSNAAGCTDEEFALLRRQGLGASDASVYLGLQTKWRDTEDLVRNKLSKELTEEELDMRKKLAPKMGHATEDLNLQMFSEFMGLTATKDIKMYKLKEYPYLTINFDGICEEDGKQIPVEAKLVGVFADKYWNFSDWIGRKITDAQSHILSAAHDYNGYWDAPPAYKGTYFTTSTVLAHCEQAAEIYGIPAYYYAQIQQQMLGLDAPYGYFTVLRLKKMEHHVFKIWADEWLQKKIVLQGYRVWERISKRQSLM